MGNFDPLFAEIARRQQNRLVLRALVLTWTLVLATVMAPGALQAWT